MDLEQILGPRCYLRLPTKAWEDSVLLTIQEWCGSGRLHRDRNQRLKALQTELFQLATAEQGCLGALDSMTAGGESLGKDSISLRMMTLLL